MSIYIEVNCCTIRIADEQLLTIFVKSSFFSQLHVIPFRTEPINMEEATLIRENGEQLTLIIWWCISIAAGTEILLMFATHFTFKIGIIGCLIKVILVLV